MRQTHDRVCAREGVFDNAIAMIREAKRLGYHVMTNTTVFKETDVNEVKALCELTKGLGVDGMLISPGYQYESVERDIFLTREDIRNKFKEILGFSGQYRLSSSPMFLEFAAGYRDYRCSPWSTVTFTPQGWKGPCYLIGEKLTFSWDEFWNKTDWTYWESRSDDRCQNCAMHSGFEASVVRAAGTNPKDLGRLVAWNLFG
jgi:hopanoid biosynthesis associated radical SAM protein HpnH